MSEPTPPVLLTADAAPAPAAPTVAPPATPAPRFARPVLVGLLVGAGLPLAVLFGMGGLNRADDKKDEKVEPSVGGKKRPPAPELEGGVAWLNTGGPLSLKKDLKG